MKKVFCVMCWVLSVIMLASCSSSKNPDKPNSNNERPNGKEIVIYAGGSSEFSWIQGSEEQEVLEYVENKYYEETGNSLKFKCVFLGQDLHSKLSSEIAAGSAVDIVISHTGGGVGVDDKLKSIKSHYDLSDIMFEQAPALYDMVKGAPLDYLTTYNNDVIGIPSVINPYKFGILVRKDWMEACGYTDNEEKAKTEFADGKNYELVDNIETFEEMCLAIAREYKKPYAVSGATWDLEKVVTLGAYGDAGYFTKALVTQDGKERIMDGGATDYYGDILALEYKWATNGVISKDANSILLEQAEAAFISGQTGIFVQDPTIQHLIKVSRATKLRNPEAEFTVLGPLKAKKDSPADSRKGFMRNTQATFAAVITAQSKVVDDIMSFMNWVYESEDNYNLCRYGIEGKHWINNGDGTYSYPEGKEKYITAPPYSGILTLVENQRRSNLRYKGYTDEELRWIDDIAGNKDNYIKNDIVDYVFMANDDYNKLHANATVTLYNKIDSAWRGKTDPATFFKATAEAFNNSVEPVQIYWTSQYKTMKARRETGAV